MQKEQRKKAHIDYINANVNPIFEKLITDILIHKPQDVRFFMIEWLQNDIKALPFNSLLSSQTKKQKNEERPNSDSDEEEHDELFELPVKINEKKKGRSSVSAEVYGHYNQKTTYMPKFIKKTHDQKERILKRLGQAFMFQALDEKEKEIVINAMEERIFSPGCFVIRQGEDGDNLYVVDSGELDCFRRFTENGEDKFLKTYVGGESFGELSLLYNAPRAATIKAKTNAILFSLDRDCFNNIVKEAAVKKRNKYEDFLSKVELLDEMDSYERSQVCDALKARDFKNGEYIIKQGEEGDDFYIVEEGSLIALKEINGEKQEVYKYGPGDYFGELALLKNIPRQASVISQSDGKLISLDRYTFKRLLGPLEEILKRNGSNKYQLMSKSVIENTSN